MFDIGSNRNRVRRLLSAAMPATPPPRFSAYEHPRRPTMMRASVFRLTPLFLLAVALMAASVFLVHNAQPAAADAYEAYLCPGDADSSLNPTDLRAFGGKRVMTLAWLNPDTDRGFGYAVRWRKSGTAAWLNPSGAVGEESYQQPRYTHDITGLEDGAGYETQVRIVLQRVVSSVNDGHALPGGCSEWVSVTRSTRGAAGSEPAPDDIAITTSGPLREGGPSVNVFFSLTAGRFEAPARAEGGATLGASIPADDTTSDWWVRWNPEVAEGAIVSVMQMYVPEDDDDNNCRKRSYSVAFEPQVAGGAYLSADFSVSVVDNDGAADTGCTGQITGSGGTGGV